METTASFRTARQYLLALEAKKQAEKALAEAKELLMRAYEIEGIQDITVDGMKVQTVAVNTRQFDVEKLESLITGTMFREVTSISINTKAFDKARSAGRISGAVEDEIVTIKPSVRIDTDPVSATSELSVAV
jgi:hypothetical protein